MTRKRRQSSMIVLCASRKTWLQCISFLACLVGRTGQILELLDLHKLPQKMPMAGDVR